MSSKQNVKRVEVPISIDSAEFNVGAKIAKKLGKSPTSYFSASSTESLIVDSEQTFGKDSIIHKQNLLELGVKL